MRRNLSKAHPALGFTLIEIEKGLVVVKSIIPNGPAYHSGVIQPGDYTRLSLWCVSCWTTTCRHRYDSFPTFSVGDRIKLTFARGYQLPPDLMEDEVDFITLTLMKGVQGFGFTISDAHAGQKVVKKIS